MAIKYFCDICECEIKVLDGETVFGSVVITDLLTKVSKLYPHLCKECLIVALANNPKVSIAG